MDGKRTDENFRNAGNWQRMLKNKKITDSFNNAFEGLLHAFANEKNIRFHLVTAVFTLLLSLFYPLTKVDLLILFLSITLVIMAEMFNTAVETIVDAFVDEYHPMAKIAKDVAAGAVLLTALNAVVVGYLLFFDRVQAVPLTVWQKIQDSSYHLTTFILILVLALVLLVKVLYLDRTKKITLQGGMPSGHTALAFAAGTAIGLLSRDFFLAALSFLLALLVGQSRIEGKIHTFWEVAIGAILGIIVTVLIFQVLR